MRNFKVVRQAVESSGAAEVANRINQQIRKKEINPTNFSIKGAFEAFIGDATEENIRRFTAQNLIRMGGTEDVRSDAFASVTSNFAFSVFMDSFNSIGGVLDQLVTPITEASKVIELPLVAPDGGINDVAEGNDYNESGIGDRAVYALESSKRGGIVKITEETILFDKTGLVLNSLNDYAKHIAMDRERNGIRRIQDLTNNKCFYPRVAGVPTQKDLYISSALNNGWWDDFVNLKTSNGLEDWTDIDAAWQLWASAQDSMGDEILVNPNVLLVPYAKMITARFVTSSTENRSTANTSNVMIVDNAVKQLGLNLTVVTSPYMNDTSTWYIGDFKSQFFEHVIIPPQVRMLPGVPERDIVMSLQFRRKSNVWAKSNRHVIKSTS